MARETRPLRRGVTISVSIPKQNHQMISQMNVGSPTVVLVFLHNIVVEDYEDTVELHVDVTTWTTQDIFWRFN